MGVPGGSPVRVGVVEYRTIWGDCCRVVWGWSGLGRRRRMIGREQFIYYWWLKQAAVWDLQFE